MQPVRTRQAGVTLVEVLVAVLVLAIGVAGAAGLQWHSLRAAYEASLHMAAVRIAADLGEHMRAHDRWRQAYGGNSPFLGFSHGPASALTAPQPCHADPCDPAAYSLFVRHQIAHRVQALLPEGRIVVCRDAEPWQAGDQSLRWECDNDLDTEAPMVIKLGWRMRSDSEATDLPPVLAVVAHP